ncbi:MAG: FAD-dependent oxidoreductase [Sphingomonas taxi]
MLRRCRTKRPRPTSRSANWSRCWAATGARAYARSPRRAGGRCPHIHGSYSHARVGHAGDRAILAAPVDDRLFFAGEACSRADFSTAHGAYQTGIDAAEAILGLKAGAPAP